MYLITKWFGTFLLTPTKIHKQILFPQTPTNLQIKIHHILNNQILPEEKKLAKNQKNLIINQKRLIPLGTYQPYDTIFTKTHLHPENYDYPPTLLHTTLQHITQKQVHTILTAPDLQIIQMVNTLDELIQTANLLQERLTHWTQFHPTKTHLTPLTTTLNTVKQEIITLQNQIETNIQTIAPNTTAVVGALITARLIAQAGSLKKLAMLPASTIQLLGAEKALFRYKKEGGNPPKHGIIYQHNSINAASKNLRGKRSRQLANKITIALKADAFTHRDIRNILSEQEKKQQS